MATVEAIQERFQPLNAPRIDHFDHRARCDMTVGAGLQGTGFARRHEIRNSDQR